MTIRNKILIIIFFFTILLINITSFFIIYDKTNKKINYLEEKITKSELLIESKNKDISKMIKIFDSLSEIERDLSLLRASFQASGGIVTDQIIVKKAIFKKDISVIDISPQPIMSNHFKGMGKFDLSDRELKVVLLEIIKELERWYSTNSLFGTFGSTLINFSDLNIVITSNNYEVATYKHEKLKLKGE